MKRIKNTHAGLQSLAAFREAVDEVATLQLGINIHTAKRDKKIQAIRDEADPKIAEYTARRDALLAAAESYAETHREELLPPDRKSSDTALAVFGWRVGNPTLKPLNARWNFARILERCRELGRTQFIAIKETLDKDRIKSDLQTDAELAEIGCRIEQVEGFYVEPKDVGAREVES